MTKRLTICMLVLLAAIAASAQRIPCDRSLLDGSTGTRAANKSVMHSIPWEGKVRIPVVLAAYTDIGFSDTDEKVRASWDAKLNQAGYNVNGAQGSAADYFRKQSGGKLELAFDVFGPVALPKERVYYGGNRNGKKGDDLRPEEMVMEACRKTGIDFTAYVDDKNYVQLVLVVFAGRGENLDGPADAVWPHKFKVFSDNQIGNVRINDYICVSELNWTEKEDGHAVICHEFSHALGLPDIYPVDDDDTYSFFDEWDLMDGGDYNNFGNSPPNYSAFERSLLGWTELKELKEPASIAGMPAWNDDPVAYVIRNDANPEEYLVLENRQQRGWDDFLPGNGLLVTHVKDYDYSLAPNVRGGTQVKLITADNRTYKDYKVMYGTDQKYTPEGRNRYFSMSAYPLVEEGKVVNDALTAASKPVNPLSKTITNIRQAADGTVSFDFMKEPTAISTVESASDAVPVAWFDLQGHTLPGLPHNKGTYIVSYSDGTIKKCIR